MKIGKAECETLYACIPVYTCSSFEPIVRKWHFELIWITTRLTSLDICTQKIFEILTIQIITLNKKI